jgi:hypothetical protein
MYFRKSLATSIRVLACEKCFSIVSSVTIKSAVRKAVHLADTRALVSELPILGVSESKNSKKGSSAGGYPKGQSQHSNITTQHQDTCAATRSEIDWNENDKFGHLIHRP